MSSYVKYKVGIKQYIISFDETGNSSIITKFTTYFSLPLEEGNIKNPQVQISLFPPKDKNEWQSYYYKNYKNVIYYYKIINKKIYFYIQILFFNLKHGQQFFALVFHSLLLSNLFNNNIIKLNAMLLNNGDVIFSDPNLGKTTFYNRINKFNQNLLSSCDDSVLFDIDENKVYPISSLWYYKFQVVDFNNSIKINRLMLFKRGQEQKIEKMNINEWKQELIKNSLIFLYHPFMERCKEYNENEDQIWIDCFKELKPLIINRIQQIVQKITNLEPLCIYVDEKDEKFEVIPDV